MPTPDEIIARIQARRTKQVEKPKERDLTKPKDGEVYKCPQCGVERSASPNYYCEECKAALLELETENAIEALVVRGMIRRKAAHKAYAKKRREIERAYREKTKGKKAGTAILAFDAAKPQRHLGDLPQFGDEGDERSVKYRD